MCRNAEFLLQAPPSPEGGWFSPALLERLPAALLNLSRTVRHRFWDCRNEERLKRRADRLLGRQEEASAKSRQMVWARHGSPAPALAGPVALTANFADAAPAASTVFLPEF